VAHSSRLIRALTQGVAREHDKSGHRRQTQICSHLRPKDRLAVCGTHQPRYREASKQYFQRLLHQVESPDAEGEDRIIYLDSATSRKWSPLPLGEVGLSGPGEGLEMTRNSTNALKIRPKPLSRG